MFSDRKERLRTLARLAMENKINPSMNTFAGFIIRIVSSNFGLSRAVANKDLDSLVIGWKSDQWKALLNDEEVIIDDVLQTYIPIKKPSEKPSEDVRAIIASIKPSNEPIKHVESKNTSYIRPWTRNEVAILLFSKAQHDMFDGVGRVFLSEARQLTDNKLLSFEDMVKIFQNKYPTVDVSRASGNIMLVYFGGRDAVKFHRRANAQVQPTVPALMGEKECENPDEMMGEKDEYKSPEDF